MTTSARHRMRSIVIAALLGAGAALPAQPPPAPPAPKPAAGATATPPLRFEETERVLEVGYYRREFFLEFLFSVTAPGAVRIKNFTSSCPCTTVAMEKTTYYPGQKGMVAAVYDYAGELAEPPVQIVHVQTDRAPQPILLRVVPKRSATGIWVERKALRWVENQPRQTQSVEVEVAPEFAALTPVATVATAPEQWSLSIERLASKGRYRLHISPTADRAAATTVKLTLQPPPAPAPVPAADVASPADAVASISLHPVGE